VRIEHGTKKQTVLMDKDGNMTIEVPGLLLFKVGHATMKGY
jgi:hypothetical protein